MIYPNNHIENLWTRTQWNKNFRTWTRTRSGPGPGLPDGLYPQETPHLQIAGYVTLLILSEFKKIFIEL